VSIETTLKYYAQATRQGRDEAAQVGVRYLATASLGELSDFGKKLPSQ